MLQSKSFTVIDQSDGFNVLPQLRQRQKSVKEAEKVGEVTRGKEMKQKDNLRQDGKESIKKQQEERAEETSGHKDRPQQARGDESRLVEGGKEGTRRGAKHLTVTFSDCLRHSS